jgi:hypothetical protein
MNPVDAAATLAEYLSTWARKKFVLVPKGRLAEKRKNQTKAPVAATVAVSNGDASDSRGDLSQTLPIAAADNDSRQAVDRIIQKYFTATGPSTSNVTSVTSAVGLIGKPDAVCGLQPCLDQCENSDDQVCRNDVSASMLTTQVDDQRRIDFGDSFASSYDVATLSPYGHPHPFLGGSNWRYRCYRCPYVSRNRNDYLYHQQFHYQLPLAGAGASKRERRDNWSPGSWMSSEHRRLAHSPAVSLADERPSTAGLGISIRPPCSQTLMIAPTTTTRRHFVIDSRPAIEATASDTGGEAIQGVCSTADGKTSSGNGSTVGPEVDGFQTVSTSQSRCGSFLFAGLWMPPLSSASPNRATASLVTDRSQTSFDEPHTTNKVPGWSWPAGIASRPDVCGKEPSAKNGATWGIRRKTWQCDRCPYATYKRSQLTSHTALHGSGQRYQCSYCNYSVGGLHLLVQHRRLHVAEATQCRPSDDRRSPVRALDRPSEVANDLRCTDKVSTNRNTAEDQ